MNIYQHSRHSYSYIQTDESLSIPSPSPSYFLWFFFFFWVNTVFKVLRYRRCLVTFTSHMEMRDKINTLGTLQQCEVCGWERGDGGVRVLWSMEADRQLFDASCSLTISHFQFQGRTTNGNSCVYELLLLMLSMAGNEVK